MPEAAAEDLWRAIEARDLPTCERLVIQLDRGRQLTPAALVKVADISAGSGNLDCVVRMEQRARMLGGFRPQVWGGLKVKARAAANDLSGARTELGAMRNARIPISGAAVTPLLRAAVHKGDVDVVLSCLELMEEFKIPLRPPLSTTVRRALERVEPGSPDGERLQALTSRAAESRGPLTDVFDRGRGDEPRVEAALARNDPAAAADAIRAALAAGRVPESTLTRQVSALLPPRERADLEHLVFATVIHKGRHPSQAFCTQVLANYAKLGDTEAVARILDEMIAAGVTPNSANLGTALTACDGGRDLPLFVRTLELLRDHAIAFELHHQRPVLRACRNAESARAAREVLAGHPHPNALLRHTLPLLALMESDGLAGPDAIAAAEKVIDAGGSLSKPYWDALAAMAPHEAGRLIVRSAVEALEAERQLSPAFCTEALSVLASNGRTDEIRRFVALMRRSGIEVNQMHAGALVQPFADVGDTAGLMRIAEIAIDLEIPLSVEVLQRALRGWHTDPEEFCTVLRAEATAVGLRPSTVDVARIQWLVDHDDLETARGIVGQLRDDEVAGAGPLLLGYHAHVGDPTATAAAMQAFIDALPDEPDPYDVSQAFRIAVEPLDSACVLELLERYESRFGTADAYTYSHALARLAANGDVERALALYHRLVETIETSSHHVAPVVAALAGAGRADEALGVLDAAVARGIELHPVVAMRLVEVAGDAAEASRYVRTCQKLGVVLDLPLYGALLNRYVNDGDVDAAQEIFDEVVERGHVPDARLYGDMVRAYAQAGDVMAARSMLQRARAIGIRPDDHHYADLLRAALQDPALVTDIIEEMLEAGVPPKPDWHWRIVASAPGLAPDARTLWRRLVERGDATADLALGVLEVFAAQEDAEAAREVLAWLRERRAAQGGHYLAAMQAAVGDQAQVTALRAELEELGLEPTADHFLVSLEAATRVGDVETIDDVLAAIRLDETDARRVAQAALALGSAGHPDVIERLIREAGDNVPPEFWRALITAYAGQRRVRDTIRAYEEALASGSPLTSYEFGAVISAYSDFSRPELTDPVLADAERAGVDDESFGVLYNLAIRAYSRAQRPGDCERLKREMEERGLPIDRYTLGPIQAVLQRMGALDDARRRLHVGDAESFAELGILLSDVVHELHQPVGILGMATRRVRRAVEAGRTQDALDAIKSLEDAGAQVANRVAIYHQLTRGAEGSRTFDLRDAVEVGVDSVQNLAQRARVELAYEDLAGPRDLLIRGNQFIVQLAIRALVTNAVQAIESAAEPPQRRQVSVRLLFSEGAAREEHRAGWADIFVSDSGPGIPTDVRAKVFERGFTTKPNRGLGLGLRMVQSAAESHGGYATVVEEVTVGAELWLRLPIMEPGREELL